MIRDPQAFSQALQSIERHVRERLIPSEAEVEARDEVPPQLVAELASLGYFGWSIP